jgi:hypothetical protein
MDENKIREMFEEIDPEGKIPEAKIDELIAVMKEQEEHPLKDGDMIGDMVFHTLQEQIAAEPDWKKRAAMAARLISSSLE